MQFGTGKVHSEIVSVEGKCVNLWTTTTVQDTSQSLWVVV